MPNSEESLPGPDSSGRFSFRELTNPSARAAIEQGTMFRKPDGETRLSTADRLVDEPIAPEAVGGVALVGSEITLVESADNGRVLTSENPIPAPEIALVNDPSLRASEQWAQPPGAVAVEAQRTGLVGTMSIPRSQQGT